MHSVCRWFKSAVIVAAVLGLLTSAWPSVAQSEQPPLKLEMKQFLEERIQEPGRFQQLRTSQLSTRNETESISALQGLPVWRIESVENNWSSGRGVSLALDADNRPHMSYYDPVAQDLKYAFYDGAGWHTMTVDSTGDIGWFSSLDLDRAGQPHISYYDFSNYDLKYAYFDGAIWHSETVDSAGQTGQFPSMVIDTADHPHISYYDATNQNLKYAYHDGILWQIQTVTSNGGVGQKSSIKLDAFGRPHIAYFDWSGLGAVKYAYLDNVHWSIETVDDSSSTGWYPSLSLDFAGHPHISYFDMTNKDLKYAVSNGNTWQIQTIDSNGWVGEYTSIDLDVAGWPRVSYFDRTNQSLKYAHSDGTMWRAEAFAPMSGDGWYPSLAIDTVGRPHVAFEGTHYAIRMTDLSDWSNVTFASYRDNNWEVYTARADGANQTRRTINSVYDSTPKLNRGATRIAFVSSRDGNYEIYSMNADGSGQTRLTTTSANDYLPTWSPDGSRITFYSYRDGNAEIYVMNSDGSNQTRLTSSPAWDGHPTWSPDGTQIAFASDRSGGDEIWLMNADGSNPHQLTFNNHAAYPAWSPDGVRLAYNDDANGDGWLDLAIINVNGTNLTHPLGYSPTNYDYAAPAWSPHGQDVVFAKIQWIYYQGNYYWVDAYINGAGLSTGSVYQLTTSGLDWWPDWQTTDVWLPSSHVKALPAFFNTTQFDVQWSGTDVGAASVMSYDIQYRDGQNGVWADWLKNTSQTSGTFIGIYGHTYYFRSRARDFANNLEAYPGGNGDTSTIVYQYSLTGKVHGNRNQPVTVVSIAASPAALNTGISRHDGLFDLYFASGGTYTLTATRNAFGTLPPMLNVSVPVSSTLPTFYLPPLDDQLSDGHFESGTLSAWNPIGPLTPTIASTAHTGEYAALLGGTVPSDTVSSGPHLSAIEQTITVPPTLTEGTLSLLYQVTAADPLSDTLMAYLIGPTDTLTFTLPVTATDWTHQWFDVAAWTVPTATLRIELSTPDKERVVGVLVDELTWGSSIIGSRPIFLPVIRR